jgi:tetratricopeptide (TPR) repeat protein
MIRTLLLLVLVTSPLVEGAKRTKLQQANSHFVQGDFDAALRVLEQASRETRDPDTLGQVHLLRGRCYAAQGNNFEAEAAFNEALKNDPNASLDPNRVDPTVVQLLEDVRKKRTPNAATASATLSRSGPDEESDEPPTARLKPKKVRFFTELRGLLNPVSTEDLIAFEIGGGISSKYFRLGLSTRVAPQFGITLHALATIPVASDARLYAQGELPFIFSEDFTFGVGGGAGGEYFFSEWVSAYLELGGRYYFVGRPFESSQITVQAGGRIWLP